MNLYTTFSYFLIYSILGWCAEMIYCAICQRKIVDRGFLYGPYCPIYGFGSLIVIHLLYSYSYNPFIIFFTSMFFTTLLEYITSFILEKLFNAKWWDYSEHKFNINGRVCLLNSVEFALLSLLLIYILHPNIEQLIYKIPIDILQKLTIVSFFILTIDFVFTLNSILNFKEKLNTIKQLADSIKLPHNDSKKYNIEISKQLEEMRVNLIQRTSKLYKRLINAFPDLEFNKFKDQLFEIKLELNRKRHNKKNERIDEITCDKKDS